MNILLVAPTFFGYRDRVSSEFVRQGHSVDCINDRPSESVMSKSLAKISYSLIDRNIDVYATKLRGLISSKSYDTIIFMGGMSFCFTPEQVGSFREHSSARFVAYLWDAYSNCQRIGKCKDLFDEVYSFEPDDCREYGFTLRPLFYSEAYSSIPLEPEDGFKYDACFIGSVHQPSKFKAVLTICNELEANGMNVYKYFYMPSSSVELLRKATNSTYRDVEFEKSPLSAEQVSDVYRFSKAVIDSPQSGQKGLTMRTLETLGAHRKLITANLDISNYDFSRYGDVAAWTQDSHIDCEFFEHPYNELPEDVYRSYSIETFAKTLLGEGVRYKGYEAA